ncbi:serine/threonine protein kinase [Streptacidiphilus sp. MAP12-20]|uniref:serine/threonine-protein kinase n=1 Tax=Streptacidiphilus sp. MAP12-20 TaxID=3156299 RepID=UPI00351246C7
MGTETGRMLAGRYLLGARLGRGGMGTVWQATDQMLDREVAVKELSVGHLAEEDLQIVQSRMKQEARAAARIKHPGVITIHDVLEQDGKPWIVMELIDGRSLSELVEQDGVLDPREAARIGAQVLAALDRGHRVGVIHRDVKPANVLLEHGTGRVVLTDFGIATFEGDSALTRTGDLVGSPDYLAPERVHGGRPGPESDLWALGATLYAAVEGQSPFRRDSPLTTLAAVVTDPLPESRNAGPLAPVLRALMAKEPQERPPAADVVRMLEHVAAGHTTNITLGPSPLRTPTQAVPAVDRQDGGYTPTQLGTAVASAEAEARPGGMPTGPTARVSAQSGFVPASASGSPRLVSGPLYAEAGQTAVSAPTQQPPTQQPPYESQPYESQPYGAGNGSHYGTTGGQRPARPRRRAWPWLLVAALVAGAAGGGAAYWVNRHPGTDRSAHTTGPTGGPSTPAPSGTPTSPGRVPAGYVWTTDPDGGFSFGLPTGGPAEWTRDGSKGSGRIDYSPDNGEHLLRFGVTYANPRSAYEQGQWIVQQVRAHDHTFNELSFGSNVYKGTQGAQLDFTFVDAKTHELRHGMEQFYKAANGNEYDVYVAYPATDWKTGQGRFEEVIETLTVPGAQ